MSRLIDEDEFYARVLEGRKFVWQMHDLPRQEIVVQTVYEDLADFVRTIPTAYDVEAVVRELEKCEFCPAIIEGDYCTEWCTLESNKPCPYLKQVCEHK